MFTKKPDYKSLLETEQKKNEMLETDYKTEQKKNELLEKEMKDLRTAYSNSIGNNAALQEKFYELSRETESEVAKLKKQTREQNAADLLLNALEAVGIIKKDPPKSLDNYQHIHNQQMASLQAMGAGCGLGQVSNLGLF